jgi:hypothetical protein
MTDIFFVFRVCAFLPSIGLLALWLPRLEAHAVAVEAKSSGGPV